MHNTYVKIIASTVFALFAFAANSVLCRLALGTNAIDATSFTTIRLLSGIAILFVLIQLTRLIQKPTKDLKLQSKGSWLSAAMLFIYAVAFSFGYISLDTSTGALILFGAVQITMILSNVVSGNKLHLSEWLGLALAFTGFVYLIMPSVTTPSLTGFVLMSIDSLHVSSSGIMLAILSGAIASGVGYFVWYIALAGLSVTQAAVLQLFVPIIAALGGVIFTSELITVRLIESSALVLGGILMVILGRYYFVQLKAKQLS